MIYTVLFSRIIYAVVEKVLTTKWFMTFEQIEIEHLETM